jgi:hypothetical protein
MTFRSLLSRTASLAALSTLIACAATPTGPMQAAGGGRMANPGHRAAMQAQMATMNDMHARMLDAKTPEERAALMAEHMRAMQGGMGMMRRMGAMEQPMTMPAEMAAHQDMMKQHMAMMQKMMDMMAQRLPVVPGKP